MEEKIGGEKVMVDMLKDQTKNTIDTINLRTPERVESKIINLLSPEMSRKGNPVKIEGEVSFLEKKWGENMYFCVVGWIFFLCVCVLTFPLPPFL